VEERVARGGRANVCRESGHSGSVEFGHSHDLSALRLQTFAILSYQPHVLDRTIGKRHANATLENRLWDAGDECSTKSAVFFCQLGSTT